MFYYIINFSSIFIVFSKGTVRVMSYRPQQTAVINHLSIEVIVETTYLLKELLHSLKSPF